MALLSAADRVGKLGDRPQGVVIAATNRAGLLRLALLLRGTQAELTRLLHGVNTVRAENL
jgi:hypothetical protein